MKNAKRIRFYCGGHATVDGCTSVVYLGKYLEIMNTYFRSGYTTYTMYRATGMWQGSEEPTYVFEVLQVECMHDDKFNHDVAYLLREAGGQAEVWVTYEQVQLEIV